MNSDRLDTRKALEPRQALQTSVEAALHRVIAYHESVGTFFNRWSKTTRDEKARLMLEHLAELQQRRVDALREYESQAPDTVLKTWLKVGPEVEVQDWLSKIEMNPNPSARDVSEVAGKLDDLLLKVLETQTKQSESEDVREFLQQLHDDETRAKLYALRSTEFN